MCRFDGFLLVNRSWIVAQETEIEYNFNADLAKAFT